MCLAPVLEKAWSSSPGVVCMFFILQLENKHPTGKASEPQEGVCAVNDCAACFVSELVSCCSSGVSKGAKAARGALGAMGNDEFLSFWTGSVSALQYHT